MSKTHDHIMICAHCGMQMTVTNDTECAADPFGWDGDGNNRITEYMLVWLWRVDRYYLQRTVERPGSCSIYTVGPIEKERFFTNGKPRPGWHLTPVDWRSKAVGYKLGMAWELIAIVRPDGEMTGEEFYAKVDAEAVP